MLPHPLWKRISKPARQLTQRFLGYGEPTPPYVGCVVEGWAVWHFAAVVRRVCSPMSGSFPTSAAAYAGRGEADPTGAGARGMGGRGDTHGSRLLNVAAQPR
jgi:hypothetical protein